MSRDYTLRNRALPFIGQIAGYNRSEGSDQNVSSALALGDLANLAGYNYSGTPAANNMIRILKPRSGTIIEAYFSMTLQFSLSDPNPAFSISISTTTSNTDLTPVVPSLATIKNQMAVLNRAYNGLGFSTVNGAGSPVILDHIDISSLLPKAASADFRDDVIVIGVHFLTGAPVNSGAYSLTKFQLELSAEVIT